MFLFVAISQDTTKYLDKAVYFYYPYDRTSAKCIRAAIKIIVLIDVPPRYTFCPIRFFERIMSSDFYIRQ